MRQSLAISGGVAAILAVSFGLAGLGHVQHHSGSAAPAAPADQARFDDGHPTHSFEPIGNATPQPGDVDPGEAFTKWAGMPMSAVDEPVTLEEGYLTLGYAVSNDSEPINHDLVYAYHWHECAQDAAGVGTAPPIIRCTKWVFLDPETGDSILMTWST